MPCSTPAFPTNFCYAFRYQTSNKAYNVELSQTDTVKVKGLFLGLNVGELPMSAAATVRQHG